MKISQLPQEVKEKALEHQKNADQYWDKTTDFLGQAFNWGSTEEKHIYWYEWDEEKEFKIEEIKKTFKVKFIKLDKNARLPEKNHNNPQTGDAGYDVFCLEDIAINPFSSAVVPIGLQVADISEGYFIKFESRSGLGFNQDVISFGGIIDNGYRGEIKLKLFNLSDEEVFIGKGKAVSQLIPYKMHDFEMSFSNDITKSERAEKGFGSSDKK
jgi:dUTP pyrophosphatase